MQPVLPAPRVVVRGEAVAEVLPDAADLTVTVEVRDRRRDAALTRLAERQRSLTDLLEAARGDLAGVVTDAVAAYPEAGDGSRVSGHVAVTTTRVRMADVAAAGELAVAVATLPDTSLHGPHWRVSRGHPVHQQVRGEAVADAVARARAYAAALGCRLTGLVEVRDVDTSGGGSARAFAMAGGGPQLDLQPAPVEVHGQVEATFTMSVPDQEVFAR
ncbi:SIMPL domain-containing protein [Modestobacter muralis]|uniref:SIMPL domain-containing protein n=1 Tax=Modestobacter muralis TaxID=1608614 RepID=A0A6P0ETY7_9ACTN|nr:SIMPL domain-containing protein [Modestobacter muralis]NEN51221.1 SIMPL domain-containing protein [Modestobacter muralis]